MVFTALLAVAVVGFAMRGRPPGARRAGVLVVPIALAVGIGLAIVLGFGGQASDAVARVISARLVAGGQFGLEWYWSHVMVVAAALAAVVLAYLAIEAIPRAFARWGPIRRHGPTARSRVADIVRALLVGVVAVGLLGGVMVMRASARPPTDASLLQVLVRHELQQSPTGIAMRSASDGYITTGEGAILHFELIESGGDLSVTTVAQDLSFPRGPAVHEGQLFVLDLGPLACENPFPQCWTAEPEEELARLNRSSGRLLSFEIRPDGSVSSPVEVLGNLPVVSSEHAPNALEVGSDGYLYLMVGNVDRLPYSPALLEEIRHPNRDWLGTVLRLRPDGTEPSIYASGFRNIFDLAFSPDGRLFGADNDGHAVRGLWLEQLLEIREGVDYGFPWQGSLDPDRGARTAPVALLPQMGSASVAWSEDVGLPPGILVGSLRELGWVPLQFDERGPFVDDERGVVPITTTDGFVTGLATTQGGALVATVFSAWSGGTSSLLVLEREPQ